MQITKHVENCSCNYFCVYGLLNSLSNKVIQIKIFTYNILWKLPFFPTNIGNSINSQSNFSFVHHNIIFKNFSLCSMFPLPECNTICM